MWLSVEGVDVLIYHDHITIHDDIKMVISVSESQMLAWMSPSVEGLDIFIYHDNIEL